MPKIQKLYHISFFLFIGLIVFLLIISIFSSMSFFESDLKLDPVHYANGWSDVSTGETFSGSSIYLPHNSSLQIRHSVTADQKADYYLFVWNPYYIISPDSSYDSQLSWQKEQLFSWQLIPLSASVSNDIISITIFNPGPSHFFNLNTLYLGTYSQIHDFILKKFVLSLMEALTCFILGILLLVFTSLLYHYHAASLSKIFLFLSFFTILSAIWLISDSAFFSFYTNQYLVFYLISTFAFLFQPVLLLLFYQKIMYHNQKLLHILLVFYLFTIDLFLVLYFKNRIHISYILLITYLFLLVSFITLLLVSITEYYQTHKKIILVSILNLIFVISGLFINLLMNYLGIRLSRILSYKQIFTVFLLVLIIIGFHEVLVYIADVKATIYYREIAYTDPVTGGYSKLYFSEKLAQYPSNNRYFLYINLLQFTVLNQIYGHANCDSILKFVYHTISSLLAPNEMICSMGNADFGLYLVASNFEQIHKRCRSIQSLIHKHPIMNISLNLQFAVYRIVEDNPQLSELLDYTLMCRENPSADYWADVNCYIYNDSCRKKLLQDKYLTDHLESALTNHELQVYLQPKVTLKSHSVESAEALVRWITPQQEVISPALFIPLFEENGSIYKLDVYVFQKVCLQISDWLKEGITPPTISVNISKIAIVYDGFFDAYKEIVKQTGIPGKYLEFELTESIAYDNYELLQTILQDILDMGASCSMDDFGKSHSNITALGVLPFHTVKMDKCFFDHDFPKNEHQKQLVKGTLQLLKGLNLKVVAEGIEEEDQLNTLEEIGCDVIQGFYFAKPMPIKSFEEKYLKKIH